MILHRPAAGKSAALCLGLLAAGLFLGQACAAEGAAGLPKHADFAKERPSQEARHVADWAVHSGDHRGLPFAIVDKVQARVFVFSGNGKLRGAAAALLGLAKGDKSLPDIGERELSDIPPADRTTPAGRFEVAMGGNLRGEDVLWIDYDGGLSMHRVINNKKERRLERLATPTPTDNRISFGCINVPVNFFEDVVRPAFLGSSGVVYVLPETRPAREVFASYDVVSGPAAH